MIIGSRSLVSSHESRHGASGAACQSRARPPACGYDDRDGPGHALLVLARAVTVTGRIIMPPSPAVT